VTKPGIELKVPSAGKNPKTLENAANWKSFASPSGDGYFTLQTKDIGDVPVRLFLTESLLSGAEDKCMGSSQRRDPRLPSRPSIPQGNRLGRLRPSGVDTGKQQRLQLRSASTCWAQLRVAFQSTTAPVADSLAARPRAHFRRDI
jgi:hypothetical protein